MEEIKEIENIEVVHEPKPRGRPRKHPKPENPEPQEPKPRGRPRINLEKVYYKPKDPNYFRKYYQEKTKIKNQLK